MSCLFGSFTIVVTLSTCLPAKTVLLGPKGPQYVTPLVKKCSWSGRTGSVDKRELMRLMLLHRKLTVWLSPVDPLASRKLALSHTEELWAAVNWVNKTRKSDHHSPPLTFLRDPGVLVWSMPILAKLHLKTCMTDCKELDCFRCDADGGNFEPAFTVLLSLWSAATVAFDFTYSLMSALSV